MHSNKKQSSAVGPAFSSPGTPRSSLPMTNVTSDFCLLAKLTSTPILFSSASGFIYRARACTRAARVRVPRVSSHRPMSARDTVPGEAAGSCVKGAAIGYLSGCWETDVQRGVSVQIKSEERWLCSCRSGVSIIKRCSLKSVSGVD